MMVYSSECLPGYLRSLDSEMAGVGRGLTDNSRISEYYIIEATACFTWPEMTLSLLGLHVDHGLLPTQVKGSTWRGE